MFLVLPSFNFALDLSAVLLINLYCSILMSKGTLLRGVLTTFSLYYYCLQDTPFCHISYSVFPGHIEISVVVALHPTPLPPLVTWPLQPSSFSYFWWLREILFHTLALGSFPWEASMYDVRTEGEGVNNTNINLCGQSIHTFRIMGEGNTGSQITSSNKEAQIARNALRQKSMK